MNNLQNLAILERCRLIVKVETRNWQAYAAAYLQCALQEDEADADLNFIAWVLAESYDPTTMRSFKMMTLFLSMARNHLRFLLLTVKVMFSPRQRPSRSSIRLLCFASMSFYEILLVICSHPFSTGFVDLSNLLHFLRAQHGDVSRGKNRVAETRLCTCCFHCDQVVVSNIFDFHPYLGK